MDPGCCWTRIGLEGRPGDRHLPHTAESNPMTQDDMQQAGTPRPGEQGASGVV